MNNNNCPLGFECVSNVVHPLTGDLVSNYCANLHTCHTWTTAWELPYYREDTGRLIVNFLETYNSLQYHHLSENPITSKYDWRKYFAEYGFAEAVALPYFFRTDNTVMVFIDNNNVCREEMQKAGYANPVTLPLQKKKELYSPDTYEGFNYQEVDLFYCGEEAINALNAGYANAVELLPTSLNEQRCCYLDD